MAGGNLRSTRAAFFHKVMGLTLIGTIPAARMESQELSPPGKFTVTMVREFNSVDTPDTAPPDAPFSGVVYQGFSIERPVDGGFGKIRWKWVGGIVEAGGDESGGGGGDGDLDPMKEVAELVVSLDQVPLGAHPNIKKILDTFGGVVKEGEITFPRSDPTGNSKRMTVNEAGESVALNPLYGVTSYLAPRVIFRLKRLDDGGNTSSLGKISTPPWPGEGGSWLKTVVNTRAWGRKFEATEEWLYANDGWDTRIYEGGGGGEGGDSNGDGNISNRDAQAARDAARARDAAEARSGR